MKTQKPPTRLPDKLTLDQVMDSIRDDAYEGFCLKCGEVKDGCEPDARGYLCDACGENQVYGAEEILLMFGL